MTEADYILDKLRLYPVSAVANMAGCSVAIVQGIANISGVRRAIRGAAVRPDGPVVKISRPVIRAGRPDGRAQVWRTSMPPRVKRIMHVIAGRASLGVGDLTGPSKRMHVVAVRFEAMAAVYDLGCYSLPLIGSWFGGRDHTSVLNAVRQHKKLLASLGVSA